jgi:4-azaleucine resistance transporter AzlC
MRNTTINNYKIGLRDGIPVGIGYLAISFAFGLMATAYELPIHEAVLISALNLTSAGQIAGLPIIAAVGSHIELALTQLLINLRYSLMSISLSQRFDKEIRLRDKFYLSFVLTDEIFAVGIGKDEKLGKKYLSALLIPPYIGWVLGTLLGAIAGNILPEILVIALGVSMYAMFIAILIPAAKASKPIALCIAISIALSCAFEYIPYLKNVPDGFVIIICALIAGVVLSLLFPIKDEEDEPNA